MPKLYNQETWDMSFVRKIFSHFDVFTAPAILRVQQEPEISSCVGGTISLALYCLFTYLFISGMISIFKFQSIISNETSTKTVDDIGNASNLQFGIMVNYLDWSQVSKYFKVTVIAKSTSSEQKIQLGQCTADQWKLLGDNYESVFLEFGLSSFLCPLSTQLLELKGTFKSTDMKQVLIMIQSCGGEVLKSSSLQSTLNTTNTTTNSTTNTTTNSTTNTTTNSTTNTTTNSTTNTTTNSTTNTTTNSTTNTTTNSTTNTTTNSTTNTTTNSTTNTTTNSTTNTTTNSTTNTTTNSTTNTTTNSTTNTTTNSTTNTTTNSTTNTTTNTTDNMLINSTNQTNITNSTINNLTNNTNTTNSSTSTCLTPLEQRQYIVSAFQKNRSLLLQVYFLDQSYNSSAQNPINYFVNNDNRIKITSKRGVDRIVEFGTFKINTDISYWPVEQKISTQGYFIDQVKDYNFLIQGIGTQPYVVFRLIMNKRRIQINRTIGKIDYMLSYVGGLLQLVVGLLAFFLMSYNQYRYQLLIAESCFNYDGDGKKIREKDFNFISFIKYSIFDWINTLFCLQCHFSNCKQIEETRDQSNCQMDVIRLFRRIRNLQSGLLYLMTQRQKISLTLHQPLSMNEVKEKRLISQYYDAIIKGKPALTIEDIQSNNYELFKNRNIQSKNQLDNQYYAQNSSSKLRQDEGNINQFYKGMVQMMDIAPDRSNMIDIALNNFPQFEKEAQKIVLNEELSQVELIICKSFYSLTEQQRRKIQQKIPLIIIHRLRKRMNQLNSLSRHQINF